MAPSSPAGMRSSQPLPKFSAPDPHLPAPVFIPTSSTQSGRRDRFQCSTPSCSCVWHSYSATIPPKFSPSGPSVRSVPSVPGPVIDSQRGTRIRFQRLAPEARVCLRVQPTFLLVLHSSPCTKPLPFSALFIVGPP
ncbi:hypothetical protein PC120_g973 [Phytophthora cactorum]|nr:hypothetical protein PC120_g973 [Phytophthora cactorum]